MCGIVGWVRFDKHGAPVEPDELSEALLETSTRGTDATGIYTVSGGVVKAPMNAKMFVVQHNSKLAEWAKSPVFIGHCRAATSGFRGGRAEASNNNNNHPHEGERYVLVHNGHYSNLPTIKDYKYRGECDTELALSYIETFGLEEGISMMQDCDGFSLVIYDKQENKVYFYRHKNPLVYVIDYEKKALLFGSTGTIIGHLASVREIWGMCVQHSTPFYSTDEDTLYEVVPAEGASVGKPIKLMKYIGAYGQLPTNVKDKLELEDFYKAKSFGKYATTVTVVDRRAICAPVYKKAQPFLDVHILIGAQGMPIYYQPSIASQSNVVASNHISNFNRQEELIPQTFFN